MKNEVVGEGDTENEEEAETDSFKVEKDDGPIDERDLEDDPSLEGEDGDHLLMKSASEFYEIVGTLDFISNPEYTRPEGILEILDSEKKSEFLEKVLSCGFIIYDISNDLHCHPKQIEEAKWVAESIYRRLENLEKHQPIAFEKYKDTRTFILISTLLTWANTKPIDPDDPSLPFTERDFRKRKPHPNYKMHCNLEKRIIELGKKYPKNLRTIVIGSGIPYGEEEDILHFYFKMAWKGDPHLPIFSRGKNIIPLIHIKSLCGIIHNVIAMFPVKINYLIATDPHTVTLKEIVKLLAKNLGNGKTAMVSKEEAFLYPDIKQKNYDMLTININIVPGYIMDQPAINWGTERPFVENVEKLILEFKRARGLMPIKIFIHGPPASGKSFLAKRLSNYYDIPLLQVKQVIDEAIQILKDKMQAIKDKAARAEEKERENNEKIKIEGDEAAEGAEEEEEDEEDEEEEDLETLNASLTEIENNMDNERHRLDEEYVLKFFKEKMLSNLCQNKGFVIDGYPKTMEHTKILYEPEEEREGQTEDETDGTENVSNLYNAMIMPDFVESLDASDEFLINRVIKMPEVNVQNTHYEESEMCRRLAQFRALNTEDNTPLIFYDELEVHPMIYNVENDSDPQMEPTFQAIVNRIGPPRNYENKIEEVEGILKEQNRICREKHHENLKKEKERVKMAAQERRDKIEQWMLLKNQELEMEEKALLVMGMPLRHYLMKYIFPTLTRGLVEVARIRPDDPIDFLSEFLFRENPEGKMFQPNFEEREEKLEKAIKEYESSLISKSTLSRKSSSKSSGEKLVRSDVVSRVSSYKCSMVTSSSSKASSKKSSTSKKSTKSEKSGDSWGICTCKKSPSLSTCSSDVTPPTPSSCTCTIPEPCEPCEPCDSPEPEKLDPCNCTC